MTYEPNTGVSLSSGTLSARSSRGQTRVSRCFLSVKCIQGMRHHMTKLYHLLCRTALCFLSSESSDRQLQCYLQHKNRSLNIHITTVVFKAWEEHIHFCLLFVTTGPTFGIHKAFAAMNSWMVNQSWCTNRNKPYLNKHIFFVQNG